MSLLRQPPAARTSRPRAKLGDTSVVAFRSLEIAPRPRTTPRASRETPHGGFNALLWAPVGDQPDVGATAPARSSFRSTAQRLCRLHSHCANPDEVPH